MLQPLSTTAAAASPTIAALRQRRSMCVFDTLPPHVVCVMKGSLRDRDTLRRDAA